jgi:hypothetical protein
MSLLGIADNGSNNNAVFQLSTDNFSLRGMQIINSIPERESQTAIHIEQHIHDLKTALDLTHWPVHLHHCPGKKAFFALLEVTLIESLNTDDSAFLLHVECHGSRDGLILANGETVTWPEIRDSLFLLNVATRNRLIVVFASCWGLYGARTLTAELDYGTPFRLVIGPSVKITSALIESALKAFYEVLLKTGKLQNAVTAARQFDPAFRAFSATEIFILGWRAFFRFPTKSYKEKQQETEKLVSRFMKDRNLKSAPPGIHKQVRGALSSEEVEPAFEAYKRKFFMLDAFPEIADDLLDLTHDNVLSLIKSLPVKSRKK